LYPIKNYEGQKKRYFNEAGYLEIAIFRGTGQLVQVK
jgi:hypothetical protein